ncbi:MAG: hypothetical protein M1826_000556 [Phylliscum demangeonii]|nr:MAG: hypothetical protein M1826_000556 [Phylliscum demangeonii]
MASTVASSEGRPGPWQEKLEGPAPAPARGGSTTGAVDRMWLTRRTEHCRAAQLSPPVWNIISDRRGGRTAWSSTVTVGNQNIPARYWYDGQYLHNAKEDAAEVALQKLGF